MKRVVCTLFIFLAGTAAACDPGGSWQPVRRIGAEVDGESVKYRRGGIIVTALESDWDTNTSRVRIHVANQELEKARVNLKKIELIVFEPSGDVRTSLKVASIRIGEDFLMGPASGRFYEESIAELGGEENYLNSPHLSINGSESRELLLRFYLPPDQVEDSRFVSVRNVTLRVPLQVGAEQTVVFEIPFENKDFEGFWFR